MMPSRRRPDIDVQLRRKYMRMKAVNDHEYAILSNKLGHLNRTTVSELEKHRKECVQVTSLWNNMTNTTGWCKDAIKPMKKDFSNSLVSFRSQAKPWAYSAHGTLEEWERYPSRHKTREHQRPKTAHQFTQRDLTLTEESHDEPQRAGDRPATVSGERGQNKMLANGAESKLGFGPSDNKKTHIVKPRPFHSPRLNDQHIRSSTRTVRPTTAGAKLGGSGNGDLTAAKVKRRLSSAVYSRVNSGSDDVFEDEADGLEDGGKATKINIKIVIPQMNALSSDRDRKESAAMLPPKSVTFKRSSSGFSSLSKRDKPKSQTRSKKSSVWSDSSSDEEFDHRGVAKREESKPETQEWKIPKFYVKPQDRYKVEDMFLMRRYTLLQRQIASEMPANVVEDNDKLKIQPTFSVSAKRKLMNQLIQQNNCEIQNGKKPIGQKRLHDRVQKFLRNIDEFIEDQNDTE